MTPEILPGSLGRDVLGEGPIWEPGSSLLYTIDIHGQKLHGSDLDGTRAWSRETPSEPGFIARSSNGSFLVGLRDGVFALAGRESDFRRLTSPDFDTTSHRINDGKVDRNGWLWYGTMELTESTPTGNLYLYDGRELRVHDGVVVSNGLGWSPDGQQMFYADSGLGTITAFDMVDGLPRNPRIIVRDTEGFSDGLTVDDEGCIWSAKWEGGRVVRYTPEGREIQSLRLPVSRVTSCAFAGGDLSILAVTTAQPGDARDEPLAGSVFLCDVGARGLAEPQYVGQLTATA